MGTDKKRIYPATFVSILMAIILIGASAQSGDFFGIIAMIGYFFGGLSIFSIIYPDKIGKPLEDWFESIAENQRRREMEVNQRVSQTQRNTKNSTQKNVIAHGNYYENSKDKEKR